MTIRLRTLIAYALSMLSLAILQVFFSSPIVNTLSNNAVDMIYCVISQVFCMGIVPFTAFMCIKRQNSVGFELVRMRYKAPRDKKATVVATIGICLLMTPFTSVFSGLTNIILSIIGYTRTASVGTIYGGVDTLISGIFFTAFLPATFEEFTHRGLLLSGLQDRGSERYAIFMSALLFALMHANPIQAIYAFFGGLLFAYIAVKTDSIIPSMCAHFANNAISVILDYSVQKKNALGLWYNKMTSGNLITFGFSVIVIFASLFAMASILRWLTRKAPKPISEYKFLGYFTMDKYSPDGKATLRDNLPLIPTIIMQSLMIVVLLIWGIIR